jgi:hypothetical protein
MGWLPDGPLSASIPDNRTNEMLGIAQLHRSGVFPDNHSHALHHAHQAAAAKYQLTLGSSQNAHVIAAGQLAQLMPRKGENNWLSAGIWA